MIDRDRIIFLIVIYSDTDSLNAQVKAVELQKRFTTSFYSS